MYNIKKIKFLFNWIYSFSKSSIQATKFYIVKKYVLQAS